MGIANIAYDSDDTRYAGTKLNGYRRRQQRLRKRLQEQGTKSAKRLLARRRRKETRHVANINHTIAKSIVTEAARTGRGIAVEKLTGIRDRVRMRKPQRVTLHSWAFQQLGAFLIYKARRARPPPASGGLADEAGNCDGCETETAWPPMAPATTDPARSSALGGGGTSGRRCELGRRTETPPVTPAPAIRLPPAAVQVPLRSRSMIVPGRRHDGHRVALVPVFRVRTGCAVCWCPSRRDGRRPGRRSPGR
ncbi:IS200/IS605 family accessory protein TnpB-related protein [Micromonospora sp. CB01531]|uniref:IS200/IS605 family accessory protein TnpB-related protein n=1 Tax=Micromonospora sp. CB01531 TaxID=1718947 RepID=UPI00093EFCB3